MCVRVCIIDVEGVQIFTRVDSNAGCSLFLVGAVFLNTLRMILKLLSCLKNGTCCFPLAPPCENHSFVTSCSEIIRTKLQLQNTLPCSDSIRLELHEICIFVPFDVAANYHRVASWPHSKKGLAA